MRIRIEERKKRGRTKLECYEVMHRIVDEKCVVSFYFFSLTLLV